MEVTPHIAFLPSPGMGHLIPFLELAKRLLLSHNFSATCFIPTIDSPSKAQQTVLKRLPRGISHVFLPAVSFEDLKQDVRAEIKVSLTMSRSLSHLRERLRSLMGRTRIVSLVVDHYGTDAFHVAEELGIPCFVFFTSNAMALSFCLHLPKLDEVVSCEYRDLDERVKVPGCVPVLGRDLMDPVRDRKSEAYRVFLHHAKRFALAEGIIVNSCRDLEGGAIKTLQDGKLIQRPVYPIGPLVRTGSGSAVNDDDDDDGDFECLRWLDGQPDGSVVYISFGSGGTLSSDQVNELALGLEMSGHRFLWVLRPPNDRSSNAAYLSNQTQNEHSFDYLREGFREITRKRGLILPSWAPQTKVLSHRSVGGFLTHCGWNSTLESIMSGVPLIAWPLYSEQKMNATMLTEGLGVALRPEASKSGLVRRQEVARVVQGLMTARGDGVRARAQELKEAAMKAWSDDGSSSKALLEFVGACSQTRAPRENSSNLTFLSSSSSSSSC